MNRTRRCLALAAAIALGLAGCATATNPQPVTGIAPLELTRPTMVSTGLVHWTLPEGVYRPIIRADEGVWYQTPAAIVASSGMAARTTGGIFVPTGASTERGWKLWLGDIGEQARFTGDEPLPLKR